MRIENLQAHGVYAYGGNCGFQANPHPEHVGALGMTFTVTDMTVENQQRAYLFDTINGLDGGRSTASPCWPGTRARSRSTPSRRSNTTTDRRTRRRGRAARRGGWPTSRGASSRTRTCSVQNVVYFGSFPQGGIPTGADVTQASSAVALKSNPRWLAGFGPQRNNVEDPSASFTSPPAGNVTGQVVPLVVAAADPDGIQSVEYRLNAGAWIQMNPGGSGYTANVTLVSGTNLVEIRSTDAGSPSRTSPVAQRSYTWTGNVTNAGPPVLTWVSPTGNVTARDVTATVTAIDGADGISRVRMSIDNGVSWITAAQVSANDYAAALSLQGTQGQTTANPVLVEATDAHAAPLSTRITHTINVQLATTTNTGPVIQFLAPPDNITSPAQTIRAKVTDPDNVNPASVELRVGTSGTWTRMQAGSAANEYQLGVVLPGNPGVTNHVAVEIRATDQHPSPVQSTQTHTFNLTLASGSIYIDYQDVRVRATATDPEGIAFIGVAINGGVNTPMVATGAPNEYAANAHLNAQPGQSTTNTITVSATDAHPADPQTATQSVTVVVTLPFDGGGGGIPGRTIVLPLEPAREVGVRWRVGIFNRAGQLVRLLTEVADPSWTVALNGIDQFKFSLRIDDPFAEDLTARGVVVKLWRFVPGRPVDATTPDFAGILGPVNETETTVTFTSFSPLWDLKKRFVWDALDWTGAHQKDQSQMMWALIDYAQTRVTNATIFVTQGNLPTTVNRERQYAAGQNIYSALHDLTELGTEGGILGGMDIAPTYINDGTATLMRFSTQPKLGILRQEARLDYYTGRRNVAQMSRDFLVDENTIGNLVRVDGQGEDGKTVIPAFDFDSASITGIGLLERWEKEDNLQTFAALKAEATDILRHSSKPLEVVKPTLTQGLDPLYGRDYAVGDTLPVSSNRGRMRFYDSLLRCYQAEITRSANGFETANLTLAVDEDA